MSCCPSTFHGVPGTSLYRDMYIPKFVVQGKHDSRDCYEHRLEYIPALCHLVPLRAEGVCKSDNEPPASERANTLGWLGVAPRESPGHGGG